MYTEAPAFIHLRCHSEYSIQDSILRIDEYLDYARKNRMPALALTDLGNLFGAIKFYRSAREKKDPIQPILGCDIWLENTADRDLPTRLLLLCQNNAGYTLLCHLLSKAYTQNQYRGRAEFKTDWFHEYGTEGLILLSGGMSGDIASAIMQHNMARADELAGMWGNLFPKRFYIEVSRTGAPKEEFYIHHVRKLAHSLSLPIVATHPIQFLHADDFEAHEARVCIAQSEVLSNVHRERQFTERQYCATADEMAQWFMDMPEALTNSVEIAKRCVVTLQLGKLYLPQFPTPQAQSLEDYLLMLAQAGLAKRLAGLYPDDESRGTQAPIYQERLLFEVGIINQMGFAGYFLIVADVVNWARNNGVPVGPGRGSGAGSLVAYSLGITDLDPIRYHLLFERFLNPERVSMPDFDIDFCQEGRDRVIDYVKNRYGTDAVSQIVTFGTMAAKAVIRDVGRVLQLPFWMVDELAKLIPNELEITISKALEKEPQLQQRIDNDESVRSLFSLARRLEGLTRNVGMHAGGVLISPTRISDFSPLYCQEDGNSIISQYDKDDVESVGLVKFDFLGLRTLTVLSTAMRYINQQRARQSLLPITLEDLALDDKKTFRLLRKANTTAVFQLESAGMKDTLRQAKPDCFEDIIALVALYRPGPMDLIPQFCRRKRGLEDVSYPHPLTESILHETYGIAVYQEQVMQIAQAVAGYSLGTADLLRRAMGKKKPEEMDAQRAVFVQGARLHGMQARQADSLFDLLEKFSGYGFNKSHAAAYALLAYQTAYLKTHHSAAFLAAVLSADMNNTDNVRTFCHDASVNQLTILPPNINVSEYAFIPIDRRTIRYGLGALKGIGDAVIAHIVGVRQQGGSFTNLFDFCARVDMQKINKRAMESLIRAGAFDELEHNRHALLLGLERLMGFVGQNNAHHKQSGLFGDEEHEQLITLPDAPMWPLAEQLQAEKLAFGFYFNTHPYVVYESMLAQCVSSDLANIDVRSKKKHLVAGIVVEVRSIEKKSLLIVQLDDGHATLSVMIGDALINHVRDMVKKNELLLVEGRIKENGYGLSMDALAVYDFSDFCQRHTPRLYLVLTKPIDVYELSAMLLPHRVSGNDGSHVYLEYHQEEDKTILQFGRTWQVKLHKTLLDNLQKWFGHDKVRIEPQHNRPST